MPRRESPPSPYRHYLKEWRLKRGLTQEQLAARCGQTKGEISKAEQGKRGIKMELQFALMAALDIRPAQFFMSPDEESADDILARASPEQRQRMMAALKALVDND